MRKNLLLSLFSLVSLLEMTATEFISPRYPADICFLIADLKYSAERGVKVCEIQHGTTSSFKGDRFSHGGVGTISHNFLEALAAYQTECWALAGGVADHEITDLIKDSSNWHIVKDYDHLKSDSEFFQAAHLPLNDPTDLASYHGLFMDRPHRFSSVKDFETKYPSILPMDAASLPYETDKYKMSLLFTTDAALESIKPRWGLYPKEYTNKLASQIIDELQCDRFVIKPRGAFLGKGVIIVDKEHLDETLRYILKKSGDLKKDGDLSYSYWSRDSFDSFLVEEFVPSDPLVVPHLNNEPYQPTLRVAFLLVYNHRELSVDFLGGYWALPSHSLNEGGSLNEVHKACCKLPYYAEVSPETLEAVEAELAPLLPLLHQKMLE